LNGCGRSPQAASRVRLASAAARRALEDTAEQDEQAQEQNREGYEIGEGHDTMDI
jgi:hypothetical protein